MNRRKINTEVPSQNHRQRKGSYYFEDDASRGDY